MAEQCQAPACATPTEQLHGWQRDATAAERVEYEVPDGEVALLTVIACITHALTPAEMSATHQASCTAPPVCDCSPVYPQRDPGLLTTPA
jgi:hypothetical protein